MTTWMRNRPSALNKTVHNVHILDASGSMTQNNKYSMALKGINEDIQNLKKDTSEVRSTLTIVEFEGKNIKTHFLAKELDYINKFEGDGTGGWTPLNQAI